MIIKFPANITREWLIQEQAGALPLDVEILDFFKVFCLGMWRQMTEAAGLPPQTKFAEASAYTALFSRQAFGGVISGNRNIIFCLVNGKVVDLTDEPPYAPKPDSYYLQDNAVLEDPETLAILGRCIPVLNLWVDEINAILTNLEDSTLVKSYAPPAMGL